MRNAKFCIVVQSGLEYRTFEFRIHSKTERFHVLYWDGSVFERSEPFMVFGFRMAVSLDRFIYMKNFYICYSSVKYKSTLRRNFFIHKTT